jgi:hypothetical protein
VQTAKQHKYLGVIHNTQKNVLAALEIVRSMVWQILDYGRAMAPSSARGHAHIRKKLEALQLRVLREILGLSSSSPKLAVYGESGDLPDTWRERRKHQMLASDKTSLPYRVAKEANEASPKVGLLYEVSVTLATLGEPGRSVESFRNKDASGSHSEMAERHLTEHQLVRHALTMKQHVHDYHRAPL